MPTLNKRIFGFSPSFNLTLQKYIKKQAKNYIFCVKNEKCVAKIIYSLTD